MSFSCYTATSQSFTSHTAVYACVGIYCLLLRETPICTVYFSGKLQSILFTSQGNSNLYCLLLMETPIYTVYFSGKLQSILFTSQGNSYLYCLLLRETPIYTVYFSGKLQSILFTSQGNSNLYCLLRSKQYRFEFPWEVNSIDWSFPEK
jgi:uncharacterized protein YaiE (UPF0345 family)